MDLCLQRLMKWRFKLTRVTTNEHDNVEVTDGFEIDSEEVIVTKSKYSPPIFYKEHALRCGIFSFCLLSFPQNERKM